MNRSVFRNALSKGDRDTCLRSLESALTGGKTLVQYLNDLLFTTACVEWEQMSWAHPVIGMNSLKNMIGEKLFALSPLKNKSIPVEIVSSHYVDPKGERVRS